MGNAAYGAGAFGAGLAKSLAGAYADKRERERSDKRRAEDRAYEVEKLKFNTMLPTILENIEDVDDETLGAEFPTIFGGKQKGNIGKTRGAITSALQQYQPGDQGLFNEGGQAPAASAASVGPLPGAPAPTTPATGAGKVVMTDLDTGQTIGEAPAVPRRTLMGVPVYTQEEQVERGIGKLETETTAKVALARRILPQLKQADPTATMDDALAVVGIRTPSASARSTAAMRPQSVRGVDAQGNPVFGIFDPTSRQYLSPDTQQPIPGFRPMTTQDTQTFGVDREAISQALFGVPFGKGSQRQKEIVLREEKLQLEEEAKSRAQGTGQGRFNSPLGIKDAQDTGVAVGTTGAQVAGQAAPTMQQLERRRSVETLRAGLTEIRDKKLIALPKETELQGLAPGAAYAVRRRLPQYRNDIATLESAINNIVNVMARAVGEQRGTQTERDALRAEAAIAQISDALLTGDTQESAKRRIDESLAVLERILQQLPAPMVPTGTPGVTAPTTAAPNAAPGVTPVQGVATPTATTPQAGAPRSRAIKDAAGNWVITTAPAQ
jgi:hypothetical protein